MGVPSLKLVHKVSPVLPCFLSRATFGEGMCLDVWGLRVPANMAMPVAEQVRETRQWLRRSPVEEGYWIFLPCCLGLNPEPPKANRTSHLWRMAGAELPTREECAG